MCVCVCEYYCQPCAHTSTVHIYTNGRALGHFNVGKFQCLWHTKSTLNIDRNSRAREREKVNQCSMLECMLYVVCDTITRIHTLSIYKRTQNATKNDISFGMNVFFVALSVYLFHFFYCSLVFHSIKFFLFVSWSEFHFCTSEAHSNATKTIHTLPHSEKVNEKRKKTVEMVKKYPKISLHL